jgi:hypothetical protein
MTKSFIISRVRCTLVLPHQDVKDVDSRLCLRRVAGAQQGGVQAHLTMHHARHRVVKATTQGQVLQGNPVRHGTFAEIIPHSSSSVKLHGGGELLLVPLERPIRL